MAENEDKVRLFISHREADKAAAKAVANRLGMISNRLEIYLASDSQFEGPRVGKSVNGQLAEALAQTSLVLLLYTGPDKDWSWCMWECGVATDPNEEVATNIVTMQLSGTAPKVYADNLMIKADNKDSVQNFVNQLCTDSKFFPSIGEALTTWDNNHAFIQDQADALFEVLKPYVAALDIEEARWDGFTISLDGGTVTWLKEMEEVISGSSLDRLLKSAVVSDPEDAGLEHFGYADLETGMTLFDLRRRWENERGGGGKKRTRWTEIIGEELWRIVTRRKPNLKWEPFVSIKEAHLWAYPVVYRYQVHSNGCYDFDILVVVTRAPEVQSNK